MNKQELVESTEKYFNDIINIFYHYHIIDGVREYFISGDNFSQTYKIIMIVVVFLCYSVGVCFVALHSALTYQPNS